jgi:hypothetical protein
VSTPSADPIAGRRRNQTAPSALRAGWISIGLIVFMFSAIILATQPGDDPVKSDTMSAATEEQVPVVLRVVAQLIGWDQSRRD